MRIEDHKNNIRESIDVIEECIQKGTLTQRQRTIGFHCSAAGIDMLEVLLHKKNLIDPVHKSSMIGLFPKEKLQKN